MSNYPQPPAYGGGFNGQGHMGSYQQQHQQPTHLNHYPERGENGQIASAPQEVYYPVYGYQQSAPAYMGGAVPIPGLPNWSQNNMSAPPPGTYTSYSNVNMPLADANANSYYKNGDYGVMGGQAQHQGAYRESRMDDNEQDEGELDEGFEGSRPLPGGSSSGYHQRFDGINRNHSSGLSGYGRAQENTPQHAASYGNGYGPGHEFSGPNRHHSSSYSPYVSPVDPGLRKQWSKPREVPQPKYAPSHDTGASQLRHQSSLPSIAPREPLQPSSQRNRSASHTPRDTNLPNQSKSNTPPQVDHVSKDTAYGAVAEAKKKAQAAILNLWPFDVRFTNYTDEGIDAQILGQLFKDLGLPTTAKLADTSPAQPADTQKLVNGAQLQQPTKGSSNLDKIQSTSVTRPASEARNGHSNGSRAVASNETAVTDAPSKPAGPTEKERTLKMKMEALRKSREERAQKAAARTTSQPIQQDSSSQVEVAKVAVPPQPPARSPPRLKTTSQPAPVQAAAQPTSLQQARPSIPGLFLSSNSIKSSIIEPPLTPKQGSSLKRSAPKEPTAISSPPKRPFGQSQENRRLVIDVSEGESDDDIVMDIDSPVDDDSSLPIPRKPSSHRTPGAPHLSMVADLPRKPFTPPPTSASNTPPIPGLKAKPVASKPEDLKRKENEIEDLRRRIAEAERRKKARASGSGTQTPRPAETSVTRSPASVTTTPLPSKVETSIQIQELINATESKVLEDQQKLAVTHAAEIQENARLKRNEDEIKRLRRVKIASDIPLVDADVKQNQMKLEHLRLEMAKIEAAIQKSLEDKRTMAEEMEKLGQEADNQLQAQKDKLEVLTNEEMTDATDLPIILITANAGEKTIEVSPIIAAKEPTPPAPEEIEDQVMTGLAGPNLDDVGDSSDLRDTPQTIVAAVPNSSVQEHVTNFQERDEEMQDATPTDTDVTDRSPLGVDEVDEVNAVSPASSASELENSPSGVISTSPEDETSSVIHHTLESGKSDMPDVDSDAYEPPDVASPMDISRESSASLSLATPSPTVEEFPRDVSSTSPTAAVVADEKTQVSLAPSNDTLSKVIGVLRATPQFILRLMVHQEGVQGPQTQFFTPYESPLKRFRAYRFHPDYVKNVRGGLKSLTYSNRINVNTEICRYELAGGICNDQTCDLQHFRDMGLPDDSILAQLGSPDGFTGEQRARFIDGLKRVLTEMRAKNIRIFDVIAPEILAHRASFLGDASKVLMLEGTTI